MERIDVPGAGHINVYRAEDYNAVVTGDVVYFRATSYKVNVNEDGTGELELDDEGQPIPLDTDLLCRGQVVFAPIIFGDVGPGCVVAPIEDDDPEVWPRFQQQPMPLSHLVEPPDAAS